MASNDNHFRYERKFRIESHVLPQVLTLVKTHPALFKTTYPSRTVNNIYLDTLQLNSFQETLSGSQKRCKFRVRWYNQVGKNIIFKPVLELKIKDGHIGNKLQYQLSPLNLDQVKKNFLSPYLQQQKNIPLYVKQRLKNLFPSLINSYCRHYFVSCDGKFRLTIDSDIIFRRPSYKNLFIKDNAIIIEIKYDQKNENEISSITNPLVFRLCKNSKYGIGLQSLL